MKDTGDMKRIVFRVFICVLCICVFLTAKSATARDSFSTTRVTFFGVSSLLVESASNALLIDGFFSRTGLLTLKRVEPDTERIEAVLNKFCFSTLELTRQHVQDSRCRANERTKLNYVLPLHGHFDHSLDSAYIAARTGASLISDHSGLRIQAATQRRFNSEPTAFDWTVSPVLVGDLKPHRKQVVPFGQHKITLFYVRHARNLVYSKFARTTDEDFKFSSNIFQLGEGQPLAAHIETSSGDIMVIGSPEMPEDKLDKVDLGADVVFLSLGGLGLNSRKEISKYYASAVLAAGARRIYPIHWDKGKTPLVPQPHALQPMFPRLHNQVLSVVSELSIACGVEFHQIPIAIPFDPFQNIQDRAPTPDAIECVRKLDQDY